MSSATLIQCWHFDSEGFSRSNKNEFSPEDICDAVTLFLVQCQSWNTVSISVQDSFFFPFFLGGWLGGTYPAGIRGYSCLCLGITLGGLGDHMWVELGIKYRLATCKGNYPIHYTIVLSLQASPYLLFWVLNGTMHLNSHIFCSNFHSSARTLTILPDHASLSLIRIMHLGHFPLLCLVQPIFSLQKPLLNPTS